MQVSGSMLFFYQVQCVYVKFSWLYIFAKLFPTNAKEIKLEKKIGRQIAEVKALSRFFFWFDGTLRCNLVFLSRILLQRKNKCFTKVFFLLGEFSSKLKCNLMLFTTTRYYNSKPPFISVKRCSNVCRNVFLFFNLKKLRGKNLIKLNYLSLNLSKDERAAYGCGPCCLVEWYGFLFKLILWIERRFVKVIDFVFF